MMDLQAAIGIHQLSRVEQNWIARQYVWRQYRKAFADLPLGLPEEPEQDTRHAYHLYTVFVDAQHAGIDRDRFLDALTRLNIGVGVHYLSIAEHPYYRKRFGWRPHDYPNALYVGRHTVSLPLSPALSDKDISDVTDAVSEVLGQARIAKVRAL